MALAALEVGGPMLSILWQDLVLARQWLAVLRCNATNWPAGERFEGPLFEVGAGRGEPGCRQGVPATKVGPLERREPAWYKIDGCGTPS